MKPFAILHKGQYITTLYAPDIDTALDKASVELAEQCGFEVGDDSDLVAMHPSEAF